MFKPSGGRMGESDMDYDTDEKSMAALKRRLLKAQSAYYRYKRYSFIHSFLMWVKYLLRFKSPSTFLLYTNRLICLLFLFHHLFVCSWKIVWVMNDSLCGWQWLFWVCVGSTGAGRNGQEPGTGNHCFWLVMVVIMDPLLLNSTYW